MKTALNDENYEAVGRELLGTVHGQVKGFQTRHRRKDGTVIQVLLQAAPFEFTDSSHAFVICAMDITDSMHAATAIASEADRLEVLLKLNQMTDDTVSEVIDFALEEGVRLTGSAVGYLAFVSSDGSELIMGAWSKQALAQCAVVNPRKSYHVSDAGLWAEPLRQRRPVFDNDFSAPDPKKRGLPAGHVALTRHMGVPVFFAGRVVAVAGVGNKAEPYTNTDAAQLTVLMEGMWRHIERKKAMDALIASEARFRLLFDTAPHSAAVNRLSDGAFLAVNRAFEVRTGWSSAEVLGKTAIELGMTDDGDYQKHIKSVLLREGKIDNETTSIQTASGQTRYLLFSARTFSFNGEPAVLSNTVDITQQVLAEQALRNAQDQLAAANEALERKRVALEEILVSVKQQKEDAIAAILSNIQKSFLPLLDILETRVPHSQSILIEEMRSAIAELIEPFRNVISGRFPDLTPSQIRVCQHIRHGLSCKQIAQIEGITVGTVNRHREQIRRKFGLTGTQTNLALFLQSLK